MLDKGDNLFVVMMDWYIVLEFTLTNLKTIWWKQMASVCLSSIICVKTCFSVIDIVLCYVPVARQNQYLGKNCIAVKTLIYI
jgi:hypothetical protein